jgi:hypothetical protein
VFGRFHLSHILGANWYSRPGAVRGERLLFGIRKRPIQPLGSSLATRNHWRRSLFTAGPHERMLDGKPLSAH